MPQTEVLKNHLALSSEDRDNKQTTIQVKQRRKVHKPAVRRTPRQPKNVIMPSLYHTHHCKVQLSYSTGDSHLIKKGK